MVSSLWFQTSPCAPPLQRGAGHQVLHAMDVLVMEHSLRRIPEQVRRRVVTVYHRQLVVNVGRRRARRQRVVSIDFAPRLVVDRRDRCASCIGTVVGGGENLILVGSFDVCCSLL